VPLRMIRFLGPLNKLSPVVVNLTDANVVSVSGDQLIDKGTESGITNSILYSVALVLENPISFDKLPLKECTKFVMRVLG
jgi:hypothetical protein